VDEFYYQQLLPLDLKPSRLAKSDMQQRDRTGEWREMNRYAVEELSEIVDSIIDRLASELNLKASTFDHASREET
jgi:hypothetical protein